MSQSGDTADSRRSAKGFFSALHKAVCDPRNVARLETLEIMTDVEQVMDLLNGLDDLRKGRLASMKQAFGDLGA